MGRKEPINIIYASDNNFARIMNISIFSLLVNSNNEIIKIWVIESNISEVNKKDILNTVQKFPNAEIVFKSVSENILPEKINLDRGSMSAYNRMLIGSILPNNISKVLYLDSDILILGNINELYQCDLKENIIGAVSDVFNSTYKKNLGIPINMPMFNNGVMLIDLEKWRKRDIENKLFEKIKYFKGNPLQGDLGLLNSVLYDSYQELEPRYNVMTSFFDFTYEELLTFKKPGKYYTKQEIENAKLNMLIRHFTTSFPSERPWVRSSVVESKEFWDKYEIERFNNQVKFNSNKSLIEKLLIKLMHSRLRKVCLVFLGFVQLNLRPIYIKIKNNLS